MDSFEEFSVIWVVSFIAVITFGLTISVTQFYAQKHQCNGYLVNGYDPQFSFSGYVCIPKGTNL